MEFSKLSLNTIKILLIEVLLMALIAISSAVMQEGELSNIIILWSAILLIIMFATVPCSILS